jgi:hypothetical protein
MWNFKTLKTQSTCTLENPKLKKLQECFNTNKWGKMYMIYWKQIVYITINSTFKN